MKLATIRRGAAGETTAVRVDDGALTPVGSFPDVGALLRAPDWRTIARTAEGAALPASELEASAWAPPILHPGKIICVGLNYRDHILEMGRELPEYPTLFAKFADAIIGPFDAIEVPAYASTHVDWEGELAIVIGSSIQHVDAAAATEAIAGYTILNDVTVRDYQYRTGQWLQGKTFDRMTPLGPVLVTDNWQVGPTLRTEVDGKVVQQSSTADLVFGPAELASYISHIVTLHPGDVIATGTPSGVGHALEPPRYLQPGSTVRTSIEGIGAISNEVVLRSKPAHPPSVSRPSH